MSEPIEFYGATDGYGAFGTGDAKLVEHTDNDDYWVDGGDGRGKNMLGRLLM